MDSEKCSRRRLRKTIDGLAWAAALALLGLPGWAQTEPAAVAALDRFLETVETLTADFHQELWSAEPRLIEEADGAFALQRPDRFVWNYRTPIEQVVLADGARLWTYDVELAQATVAPLGDGGASPAQLLSGEKRVRDDFEIVSDYARGGRDWVRLVPKQASTDFSSVAIGFDEAGRPREIELVDGLNQTTHIEFTNIVVNEPLDPDVFELDLPDDVDVIGRVPE